MESPVNRKSGFFIGAIVSLRKSHLNRFQLIRFHEPLYFFQ